LCGRDDAEPRFEKEGFRVVRCRACRLVYVNPRLSIQALSRMYNAQTISRMTYYVQTARDDEPSFVRRLELIEKHRKPGKLLDVGCGPGTFLAIAAKRGWSARGIDINAASVERCTAAGLDALAGPFPNPALAGERFDVVVFNDVIEHLTEPRAGLRTARESLAPGGLLFISTPDIGALVARISGRRWLHLKPVEHLTSFDRRTLAHMLDLEGFDVLQASSIGRNRSLALVLDRLGTYGSVLSRLSQAVVPRRWAERMSFPLDPGDEMAVLARLR
jgi:2-polyprenyl-3-methyl-5-hydroxy-6-metoxy-1,4-benzoquinol methylase